VQLADGETTGQNVVIVGFESWPLHSVVASLINLHVTRTVGAGV
jgi:hypothetical protein